MLQGWPRGPGSGDLGGGPREEGLVRDTSAGQHHVPDPLPFDEALRERIRTHLGGHRRRVVEIGERRHAAVALVLVDSTGLPARVDPVDPAGAPVHDPGALDDSGLESATGGAAFLLCRRPLNLRRHAGQYALPGGRLDEGEGVVEAALRETHEEVGLELGEETVLGLLDDYETRSGFVMTPVVVWAGSAPDLRPDPGEVHAVYRVGLHHLLREDSPRISRIPQSPRPVLALPLGDSLIHAPTAAVLLQLGWLGLQGRPTPVHGFESPTFAWR